MPFERFARPQRGWRQAVKEPTVRVYPTGRIVIRVAGLRAMHHPEQVVLLVDGTRWGIQKTSPSTGRRVRYPQPNQGVIHAADLVHTLHLEGEYKLVRNTSEVHHVGVFWEAVRS